MKRKTLAFLLTAAMVVESTSGVAFASTVDPAVSEVVESQTEEAEDVLTEESAVGTVDSLYVYEGSLYMTDADLVDGDYSAVISADGQEIASETVSAAAGSISMDLPEEAPAEFTLTIKNGEEALAEAKVNTELCAADAQAETTEEGTKLTWTANEAASSYMVIAYGEETTLTETEATEILMDGAFDSAMIVATAKDDTDSTVYGQGTYVTTAAPAAELTAAALSPMLTVTATAGENELTVFWNQFKNTDYSTDPVTETPASSYKVVVKGVVDGKEKTLTHTVSGPANQTTFETTFDSGVKGGVAYTYTVTALDEYKKAISAPSAESDPVTPTAATAPAAPKVTAKAAVKSVTLSWNSISCPSTDGAIEYTVQNVTNSKKKVNVKEITDASTSYTVTGLAPNSTYKFRVCAKNKVNGYYSSWSWSTVVTVKTTLPTLTAPKTLTVKESANNNYKLTWSKVTNATGYKVYVYDFDKKAYKSSPIATVKGKLTYTAKVDPDFKHKFKVVAYYAYKNSAGTAKTLTATKYIEKTVTTGKANIADSIHSIYYKCTAATSAPVYTKCSGGKLITTLKKGTAFTVTYRRAGRCTVKLKDGTKGYLNSKFINFKKNIYTTTDYTTEQKEYYVNLMGYSSPTEYLLWVSTYTQRLNIFKGSKGKWKLYKCFRCSTGKRVTPTHLGETTIKMFLARRYNEASYENYMTCWAKTPLPTGVHGYVRKASTGKPKNTVLGRPMSNGCCRVADENAYWCYTHIKKGTTVERY